MSTELMNVLIPFLFISLLFCSQTPEGIVSMEG